MVNEIVKAVADITLRRGATGNGVKALQSLLNYRGAGLTVDGVFGANTETRVLEFQRAVELLADGIVGTKTWSAIRDGMAQARVPGNAINLRATPDRTATIIQTLQSEDKVRILGRSPVLDEDYRWFQVEARQKTGWVREDLIRLYNPFTIPLPVVNGVTIQIRPRPWFMEIDPKIEAGIRSALTLGFRDRIRYMFQSLDFDGTGPKGIMLVYLLGSQVCGTSGCTLLVLQSTVNGYRLMSRIPTVQQPVIISNQNINGYPDLIVYTAGGGLTPAYRRLRFNGSSYPTSPTLEPALPTGTKLTAGVVLASRITPDLAAPLVAV
ncbi:MULTISPECIES: peptidoglycan-binding protein [Calothrix]|uniref:Peptidoglycan-binding protein n=2 Tax=Calothrix TaxID=1186 RepID=A0ABR8AQK9_9CYAN|nr:MULTISPECIES: peptidoglycan-binding protein [Calothrix]MBD2200872.1 peptidoglycan-binding protein [Calothrix parietina FACHB-288]MBD2229540.1 peptidoglycan-binding protein [Calothrix anomala FACHB-343]